MAVTSTDVDLAAIQLQLKLEGFEWRVSTPPHWIEPMIWLQHPDFGVTWFRGWEMVSRHCNDNWEHTYWPNP